MPVKLKVTMPSDSEVTVTREFDAPRDLVFDCHTKPEYVRRWLLGPPGWTMPECEIDLRPGGRFRYLWRGPAGEILRLSGIFHEIDRPARIVHTERFDEDWAGGEESRVTSLFEERDGRTIVRVTVRFSGQAVRDAVLATGMTDGWGQSYDRLDDILAGREPAP